MQAEFSNVAAIGHAKLWEIAIMINQSCATK